MMPTVLQLKGKKKNRKKCLLFVGPFWECIHMCTIVLDFLSSCKEPEEIKLSIYELKLRLLVVEVRQKNLLQLL